MTDHSRYKNAYEMLKEIADVEDKDARREAFRNLLRQHQPLAILVQYAFHPEVTFDLPDGRIPDSEWKPNDIPNQRGMWKSTRMLRHLTTKSPLSKMKKQMIYIKILETLDRSDAELLISIIARRMPFKTLNKLFIQACVPELFPPAEEAK